MSPILVIKKIARSSNSSVMKKVVQVLPNCFFYCGGYLVLCRRYTSSRASYPPACHQPLPLNIKVLSSSTPPRHYITQIVFQDDISKQLIKREARTYKKRQQGPTKLFPSHWTRLHRQLEAACLALSTGCPYEVQASDRV